jgi:hypothetical protein
MSNEQTNPIPAGKLMAGMVVLAVGVAGVMNARELWRYWPLLLIFIGIGQEADAIRTRRGGGGFFLIAVGVWMLAGSLRLFGLAYGEAFSLAVVVAGLGTIIHALLGISSKKEDPRERQQ